MLAENIALTDAKDTVSYKTYDHPVLVAAMGGNDRLSGSRFNDTLDGGAGNDRLLGDIGDDSLAGGPGCDHIRGGAGDDVVMGGAGRDWLSGGTGHDAFVFDTAPGPENVDRILDFRSDDDVFRLDSSVFAGLEAGALDAESFVIGTAAVDGNDRIVYDKNSGALLFDADGNGGAAAIRFTTVTGGISMAAEDFLIY